MLADMEISTEGLEDIIEEIFWKTQKKGWKIGVKRILEDLLQGQQPRTRHFRNKNKMEKEAQETVLASFLQLRCGLQMERALQ